MVKPERRTSLSTGDMDFDYGKTLMHQIKSGVDSMMETEIETRNKLELGKIDEFFFSESVDGKGLKVRKIWRRRKEGDFGQYWRWNL